MLIVLHEQWSTIWLFEHNCTKNPCTDPSLIIKKRLRLIKVFKYIISTTISTIDLL